MDDKYYLSVLPGGNYLIISSEKLEAMRSYRQNHMLSCESGGLIVGSLHQELETPFSLLSPPHIEIVDLSLPGMGDRRSRHSFFRNGKHHVRLVEHMRSASDGAVNYIGEWHTHPELHPRPSAIDINNWKLNLKGRHAILIIIGTKSEWVGYWNGVRAEPLPNFVLDD